MNLRILFSAVLTLVVVGGCAIRKDLETGNFNPINKAPIDDGTNGGDAASGTKYCQRGADGNFNEDAPAIDVETGANGVAAAEGGGCILRPIREVWAVLNNLDLMRFKDVDSYTSTREINPTADFTHLYTIVYSKNTAIGPLSFTIEWYHGVGKGSFENPSEVNVAYQRTKGTSMIPTWFGGIGLVKINERTTSFSMKNNFLAHGLSSADNQIRTAAVLTEFIGKLRTGAPDWPRLDDGLSSLPAPNPTPANSTQPVPTATPAPTPAASPAPSTTPATHHWWFPWWGA